MAPLGLAAVLISTPGRKLIRVVEVWLRQKIYISGECRFLMDWVLKEHSR
jgi:hypothetical protein